MEKEFKEKIEQLEKENQALRGKVQSNGVARQEESADVKTKLERLEESTELRGFLNRLLERDAEQLAHGIEETGLLTNVKATVKAVPRDEEAPEVEFKVDGLSDKPPKEMKKRLLEDET